VRRAVLIGVVVAVVLAACTRGSTPESSPASDATTSSTTTTNTTPTTTTRSAPPTVAAPPLGTIQSWKVAGEEPTKEGTPNAIFCLSPDPPAPCRQLDGAIDLGWFGAGERSLDVRVHFTPMTFNPEQFATNVTGRYESTATTVGNRPAWVVAASIRSGNDTFLVVQMTGTAYASALAHCSPSTICPQFPLADAQRLLGNLAPTEVTVPVARWLGKPSGRSRSILIPFGERACRVRYPIYADRSQTISIPEDVITTISGLDSLCRSGGAL
jgi:hypothetical protein